MAAPVIGIFADRLLMPEPTFTYSEKNALNLSYTRAVSAAGGVPVILPYTLSEEELIPALELCDGFIVPGGGDMSSRFFHESPHPCAGTEDLNLDRLELAALDYLFRHGVPTLGICRGCQVMNVFAGGSIYQDLPSQYGEGLIRHRQTGDRGVPTHAVALTAGSRLAELLGEKKVYTNSMHHQAVRVPGKGFAVSAAAEDGVIEAIEHENGVWTGVQWHPEELLSTVPPMLTIFTELVDKAKIYAAAK